MISSDNLKEYLESFSLNLVKTNNSRWIDQKVSFDNLSIVSDCIINYTENIDNIFTRNELQKSTYSNDLIMSEYKKPSTSLPSASNEYDKFFGQPLKTLSQSNILEEKSKGREFIYNVSNKILLKEIANNPNFSLKYLIKYIEKFIKESKLSKSFDDFFHYQDSNYYKKLKDDFTEYMIKNTPINGKVECHRIFIKVLNPISFDRSKLGTYRGNISKDEITKDLLVYNRKNWRDIHKPKSISRKKFLDENQTYRNTYLFSKIKTSMKQIHGNKSEMSLQSNGTEAHHIFKSSDYPDLFDMPENIILLTPDEHRLFAHPNQNFNYTDPSYQKKCLIKKLENIIQYPDFYNLSDFTKVLSRGYKEKIDNHNIDYLRTFIANRKLP